MSKNVEILVVEENPAESEYLKHILELHEYSVSVENNGRIALDAMSRRKPQIVISAVMLPDMDGYALCRKIKADEQLKDVSVILLTSLSDTIDIIRGMECGADNFVNKPYDEKLLISRIKHILLNRELRDDSEPPVEVEIISGGEDYAITPERQQMIDLLSVTYKTAVQKNLELQKVRTELNNLSESLEERVKGRTGELTREVILHKAAEAALNQQQKFLRQMIDANPNIIFVKDEKGKFVLVNQAMARLYGKTVEDIIGKTAADFMLSQEDTERILEQDKEVLSTLQSKVIPEESVANLQTGEVHWLHTIKTPLLSSDGLVRQILVVATDITERKRISDALIESEQRYRLLGEGIWHQVWTAQPDGKLDYVNGGTLSFFGLTKEQLLSEGWHNWVHSDDLIPCVESWKKSLQTGENYEAECRLKRADGTFIWHLARANAGRDSNGKIIKWFGTNTDINKQKLAEEALDDARFRLEAALEAGTIATWNYDILNNQIFADKNLAKLFSVSPENAAGGSIQSYISAIHPEDRQRVEVELEEAVKSGNKYESEYRIVQPDSSLRWVIARGRIERDATGKAIRMPGVIFDTSERKQVEEALAESEKRLQQSQKMEAIGTLTGGVAHDFNNLLTAIIGNVQLALRKAKPEDSIQHSLQEIEKAGNRAALLTRQLLAFSRRQHLERRTINLNEIIADFMKMLERIIGEDVEMSVQYASDLPAVFADPAQIEQVVMNLAVNARDAMPEGGKLNIETYNIELDESYCQRYPDMQPGRYAQIRVSDSGSGMDEETQARIFEPYFTTKGIDKGTGLGLSIVYGIVKQHDGHINVCSELGRGTIFQVFLPIVKQTVEEETQPLQPSLLGGTETILVAEDEEPLRNLAKDILEGLNYKVLLAKNGEEAVQMFTANREQIDMLLFDVVMPHMSGVEAAERIRASGSRVPLIFMTGYSYETVQNRFEKQNQLIENIGALVIQKPYSLQFLGRKVREVLDTFQKDGKS